MKVRGIPERPAPGYRVYVVAFKPAGFPASLTSETVALENPAAQQDPAARIVKGPMFFILRHSRVSGSSAFAGVGILPQRPL